MTIKQARLTALNTIHIDRRSVLKYGAAASALPLLNAVAQSPVVTPGLGETMRVLSEHMAQASVSPLPAEVVEKIKKEQNE